MPALFRAFQQLPAILPRSLWLAAWLALVPLALYAQRLPIKFYTTADGLPSSFIQHLVADSRGFIWVCTRNGLSRFDGAQFVNYTTADGLPHTTINDLLESRDGTYGVATNGGGVARFNPGVSTATETKPRFAHYPVGTQPASNAVNRLREDRQGRIWAASDAGVYQLDPTRGETAFRLVELPAKAPDSGNLSVYGLLVDRRGAVWAGFYHAGLFRIHQDGRVEDFTHWQGCSFSGTLGMLEDRAGNLWVADPKQGLWRFEFGPDSPQPLAARRFTRQDGLPHYYIDGLYQFADGRLWATTDAGVCEFDGARFKPLAQLNRLIADGRLSSLVEDRAGNLWFRTNTQGIAKLIGQGFTTWERADAPGLIQIYPLFESAPGELFANAGNWMLNRFDGQGFTSVRLPMPPETRTLWLGTGAYRDRAGEWWVTSDSGLFRFAPVSRFADLAHARAKSVYRRGQGLPHDSVQNLYEDARGDLWISTDSQSGDNLVRWERASETFHPVAVPAEIPPSHHANTFQEDRAGNLWLGFYASGVARYRAGHLTVMNPADGWPRSAPRAFCLDQAGRLWVAANDEGVFRVDDPQAAQPRVTRRYTAADGLSSNNVRALTEDQWGRIYVGTASGVDRLDLARNTLRHFTTADGLSNEFILSARRDARGHLWFGTMDGVSRLIPAPDPPSAPPPVYLNGLRIAGLPHGISELGETAVSNLRLTAAQNNLELSYFGFSLAFGERLRFQYKLEGADRDWHPPGAQRSVNYANLGPGDYRFLVRAINADGLASDPPASVAFTILAPVYLRWWFLTLAALTAGAFIYALYRYRLAQVLAVERVRMRIATDLHDDIGSNLTRIAMLSEVAQQRLGAADPEVAGRLTRVADISRESVDALGDIVWAINPDKSKLSDLTQRMRRVADDLCAARGIELLFHAEAENAALKLETDLRREVLLIFKECLNNAARHSGCRTVEVEFRHAGGWLRLQIRDDGSGFAPAEAGRNGHGLASMRQRAQRLGGQLDIAAPNGHGTTVTLQAPLKKTRA